jgi:hypothetical protein
VPRTPPSPPPPPPPPCPLRVSRSLFPRVGGVCDAWRRVRMCPSLVLPRRLYLPPAIGDRQVPGPNSEDDQGAAAVPSMPPSLVLDLLGPGAFDEGSERFTALNEHGVRTDRQWAVARGQDWWMAGQEAQISRPKAPGVFPCREPTPGSCPAAGRTSQKPQKYAKTARTTRAAPRSGAPAFSGSRGLGRGARATREARHSGACALITGLPPCLLSSESGTAGGSPSCQGRRAPSRQ